MKRHTGMIIAQGNDGQSYILYIYTNDAPARTYPLPGPMSESPIELATSDGQPVRWRAKGLYEIIMTGVLLRSYTPDAP